MIIRREVVTVFFIFVIYDHRCSAADKQAERELKATKGFEIAMQATVMFVDLFDGCLETNMGNPKFVVDNLKSMIMSPVRTTVGFMPKFTQNRKFFANLIATTAFKEMLNQDLNTVRINLTKKMKFCDNAILDQANLRDFYDREVDQGLL